MSINEFEIIAKFFQRTPKRSDVIQGIGDDCAVLRSPSDKNLIVSTDTLNVGSHFFSNADPYDIGYKSVAVSLSDIAAMGGEPAWMTLALTLPEANEKWLCDFSNGLFSCMEAFDTELVGGNTARGPLSITTQIMGFVDQNNRMKRNTAKPGDLIYVTNTVGNAALALAILKGEIKEEFVRQELAELLNALHRPIPRIIEGKQIATLANAAIDISDGLLADLQHILNASQVGAIIDIEKIPVSSMLKKIAPPLRHQFALNGGDDYELCFTIAKEREAELHALMMQQALNFTCIGSIEELPGIRIVPEGYTFAISGYKHF